MTYVMNYIQALGMMISGVLSQTTAIPFAVALTLQILLLIWSIKNSTTWKWVILLCLQVASIALACWLYTVAHEQDHLGYLYLSFGAAAVNVIMAVVTTMLWTVKRSRELIAAIHNC